MKSGLSKNERGAINFEYVLLAALVALAIAVMLPYFSEDVKDAYRGIGGDLQTEVSR